MTALGSQLAKVEATVVKVIKNKGTRVDLQPRIPVMGLSFHTPPLLVQLNQLVAQTLMPAKKVTIILDPDIASRNPSPQSNLMRWSRQYLPIESVLDGERVG